MEELRSLKQKLGSSKQNTELVASIVILSHRLAGAAETYGFSALTQVAGMLDDFLTLGGQHQLSGKWDVYVDLLIDTLESAIQTEKDPTQFLADPRMKQITSAVESFLSAAKP
jgi:HPt (histidine-containing phosphotransfer) domain-containing protein